VIDGLPTATVYGGSIAWPPPSRAPLPPPPSLTAAQPSDPNSQCWSQQPYDVTIPFVPPNHPDPTFIRGNFTLLVPGFTGGFNDKNRSLLITWELPALSESDQDLCIDYIARVVGWTHIVLSIPQTKNLGKSLADLAATVVRCKLAGLCVIVVAVSDGDPFSVAVPWLDTLNLTSGKDWVCFCWQADRYYSPDDLCQGLVDQSAYCEPGGLYRTIHWLNGACAWWPATKFGIFDRFQFQKWAVAYLNTHLMQLDQNAPLDELQSAAAKILISLPSGLTLCYAECAAQGLYDNPTDAMALYGRQKGRYMMASHSGLVGMLGGYLNDASLDNGELL